MRALLTALLLVVVLASSARAGWSAPASLPGPLPTERVTAAAAGGLLAVAWVTDSRDGRPTAGESSNTVAVRVAVRRSAGGRLVAHTVSRRSLAAIGGLTVAVTPRGEVVVAWIDVAVRRGRPYGPKMVRSAVRSPSGHWARAATVGRSTAFLRAHPQLAAGPDGRVVLIFVNASGAAPGVAAAWRDPGGAFGPVASIGPPSQTRLLDPNVVFDAVGRVFVYGIAGCDTPESRGVVVHTGPGSMSWGTPVVAAPSPASDFAFALGGPGTGVAAWQAAACSNSEVGAGRVRAAVLRNARFGRPVNVQSVRSGALTVAAVAHRDGTGVVSWTATPDGATPLAFMAPLQATGTFAAAGAPVDGLVPIAGSRAGDEILATHSPNGLPDRLLARAAGAQDAEAAPGVFPSLIAPGGFDGRTAIVGFAVGMRLRITTWTPPRR